MTARRHDGDGLDGGGGDAALALFRSIPLRPSLYGTAVVYTETMMVLMKFHRRMVEYDADDANLKLRCHGSDLQSYNMFAASITITYAVRVHGVEVS